MPMRFATSRASQSFARRTYAFFLPSGRIRVLTLITFTSYNSATAFLIWFLFDRVSTRKTRVLISSIFFIADSVVTGTLMILYLSMRGKCTVAFEGYFGVRFCVFVFGRKKCVFL